MAYLSVIVAAIAGFGVGAVWYNVFSKQWIADSGVPLDPEGRPMGRSIPVTFSGGFLCILAVAGMMRHMLAGSGIDTAGGGLVAGLGVGLFFIAPWLLMNVLYANRPLRLAVIDGGYAAVACAAMGLVLGLF